MWQLLRYRKVKLSIGNIKFLFLYCSLFQTLVQIIWFSLMMMFLEQPIVHAVYN
jgi:hypothetical protein